MKNSSIMRGVLTLVRCGRGNAGVEFALLLPLMVLLLFGGIELGRALHDFHVVNETVRDAARYLSRTPGVNCPNAGPGAGSFIDDPTSPYTAAQHLARARALAMTGDVDTAPAAPDLLGYWNYPAQAASVTISVNCIDNPESGGDREFEGLYAGDDFVPHVELTAAVPFTFLFGGLVAAEPTITITLSHNVAVIGL